VRYTRDGQLVVDGGGRLATDTGDLVLGTSGSPITVGQSTDPSTISIDARGTVKVGTRTVGTLAVMSLTCATKQGDTLFTGSPGLRPAGTTVQQGFLEGSEGSGVQPAEAMVDMIVSFRSYETTQRAIQTIDTELGKAAGSVGSATGE